MSAPLPRVLVVLTYGFSVRYAVPTGLLDELRSVAEPVVGLGWDDPELEQLIRADGHRVERLPEAQLSHDYRMFRRRLGVLRDRRMGGPTVAIRRRRRSRDAGNLQGIVISGLRHRRDQLLLSVPGGSATVEASTPEQVRRGTNVDDFIELLASLDIDAVLSFTPFHEQDELALCAARLGGRRSVISMISFDNPTTRGPLVVRSDRLMVWNSRNSDQLLRSYPDLRDDQVRVVGAPQFDLHRRPDLVMDRERWCAVLGLPRSRPVILYGAGPRELVPGEERLVRLLDDSIAAGRLPGDPVLLVRRHPVDPPDRWAGVGSLKHTVVVDPWAEGPDAFRSWPSRADIEMQMSTLAHCSVHVNICSSMSLDGALFDRPQVCPTFVPGASRADRRTIADLRRQEHWQPVTRSGGVRSVGDPDELLRAVAAGLEHPEADAAGRRALVRELLTFDDGSSTERLVEEVGIFLGSAPQAQSRR